MTLRIGLVTDIHCGPDMDTRLGSRAMPLLERFGQEMVDRFRPDLIVDLGDRINDVDPQGDRGRIRQVKKRLEGIGVPVLYLHGNHDLINVPAAEQRDLLGKQGDYESVDVGGVHLILLNSQDPTFEGVGGTLSATQLQWLEADLAAGTGPVVVFCHHSLDEQDGSAHWYFKTHPLHALAVNRERARALFARSGRVRAVFSGHMHWNHMEVIEGIPYLTVASLVDCSFTEGQPAGAFSEVLLAEGGRVEVTVRGGLPMSFTYP